MLFLFSPLLLSKGTNRLVFFSSLSQFVLSENLVFQKLKTLFFTVIDGFRALIWNMFFQLTVTFFLLLWKEGFAFFYGSCCLLLNQEKSRCVGFWWKKLFMFARKTKFRDFFGLFLREWVFSFTCVFVDTFCVCVRSK